MTKHIVLTGFKSAGKSAIGIELAKELGKPFVDLDQEIQKAFIKENKESLNCRQIMLKIGQENFRKLEGQVLAKVLQRADQSVIALGGGAPMFEPSRKLIAAQFTIQITAPKNIVFERIMVNGRPAFFSADEHPMDSFNRIWDERAKVYDQVSVAKISNNGSIIEAVEKIKAII